MAEFLTLNSERENQQKSFSSVTQNSPWQSQPSFGNAVPMYRAMLGQKI
jgi:hypothetical protein